MVHNPDEIRDGPAITLPRLVITRKGNGERKLPMCMGAFSNINPPIRYV